MTVFSLVRAGPRSDFLDGLLMLLKSSLLGMVSSRTGSAPDSCIFNIYSDGFHPSCSSAAQYVSRSPHVLEISYQSQLIYAFSWTENGAVVISGSLGGFVFTLCNPDAFLVPLLGILLCRNVRLVGASREQLGPEG